ncbi:MAG: hypothetical protein JXA11_01015, partial [Phycisphaerae bacterium]|nr:hypothetical protein [Phycisphaerae bacterium]
SITAACGEPTGHKKKPPPEAAMIYPRTLLVIGRDRHYFPAGVDPVTESAKGQESRQIDRVSIAPAFVKPEHRYVSESE